MVDEGVVCWLCGLFYVYCIAYCMYVVKPIVCMLYGLLYVFSMVYCIYFVWSIAWSSVYSINFEPRRERVRCGRSTRNGKSVRVEEVMQ